MVSGRESEGRNEGRLRLSKQVEGFARIRFGSPSIRHFLVGLRGSVTLGRACTDPLHLGRAFLDPFLRGGLTRIRRS